MAIQYGAEVETFYSHAESIHAGYIPTSEVYFCGRVYYDSGSGDLDWGFSGILALDTVQQWIPAVGQTEISPTYVFPYAAVTGARGSTYTGPHSGGFLTLDVVCGEVDWSSVKPAIFPASDYPVYLGDARCFQTPCGYGYVSDPPPPSPQPGDAWQLIGYMATPRLSENCQFVQYNGRWILELDTED
jgi:hypothetical protein